MSSHIDRLVKSTLGRPFEDDEDAAIADMIARNAQLLAAVRQSRQSFDYITKVMRSNIAILEETLAAYRAARGADHG